jgi:uncharacterized repeat protein (TIGR01451 family)
MMTISTRILGIILLLLLSFSLVAPAAAQSTLEVNSANGGVTGDCDVTCTLLDAIDASEGMVGVQTIEFNIPGAGVHTIQISSSIQIHESVIIDATTQPGYAGNGGKPLIQIQPSIPASSSSGFSVSKIGVFDSTFSVTIRGLAINGFPNGPGISLTNGQNHLIEKNFIGINAAGTAAQPNDTGIVMFSPNNIIRNNVISGNENTGLYMINSGDKLSTNNLIVGNFIGTNFDGTAAVPNQDGIALRQGANHNTIGGMSIGDRNIISGNAGWGIFTDGNDNVPTFNSNSTTILGNYIGTDATGNVDLGNAKGIYILRSDSNVIGGTTGTTPGGSCTGACNLISGNGIGIEINSDNGGTSENNTIEGNFVGTDVTGTEAIGNDFEGVILGAFNSTVGGTTPQARNLISGNTKTGLYVSGLSVTFNNVILGNYIGTDTTGLNPLGNHGYGILLYDSFGNQIGDGTDEGGNWIGFNGLGVAELKGGIGIQGSLAQQNLISGNSIFYNYALGIDLIPEGLTENDTGDGDTGANSLQNFPVLTSVVTRTDTTLAGTLNSAPNRNYAIELFANSDCDESGYGEGEFYLGGVSVTTNGSGDATFSTPISPPLPADTVVTAVAIDDDSTLNSPFAWNTSEFSACKVAQADLSLTKTDSVDPVLPGDNLTYTMVITNPANASYAENTVLADILPLGLGYVSAVSTQGTCSYDTPSRVVTCDVGQVTNGATVTITLNTAVDANIATASVNNSATVTSDTADPVVSNNTASQSTAIAQSNMRVTMTDTPDPIAVDALLTYTLNVSNLGPNPATNVSVSDTLPSNITFVGVTTTQGTCMPGVGTVNCNLGSIANGGSAVITIIIRPNFGTQNTTISSTAVVSALQVDTVTSNNTVIASTKVNVSTGAPTPYFFITPTPELTWTGVTWATAYEVQVSANTSFIPVKFDDAFSPYTLSIVTDPLPDGLWYWRVRAQNADGTWAGWSSVMSFVVDTP